MKVRLNTVVVASLVFSALLCSNASASNITEQERNQIIENTLNCFSNHASQQDLDWEDVCVTKSNLEDDAMDSKTIDEMIQEHENLANDMLNDTVLGEDSAVTTVDDVYEKHNQDEDTYKTVDDVIDEQGVYNESKSRVDSKERIELASAKYDSGDVMDEENPSSYSPAPYDVKGNYFARDDERNENQFELGFEYNRYRYAEPIFDLLTQGNLFGAYGSYTARPAKNDNTYEDIVDVYKVEARYNYGLVDYKSAPSGFLEDNHDWSYEVRFLAGKDFLVSTHSRLTPLMGLGYRYLNDDSSGRSTSTGDLGYERESHYFYIPLGFEFTTHLPGDWLVTPAVEYDIFIQGRQWSRLSDVPGYPDVKNKQTKGYGVRGSLKFIKVMDPISLVVEPYIRFWHIDDSDPTTVSGSVFAVTGIEPENKTTEYGVRVGAIF